LPKLDNILNSSKVLKKPKIYPLSITKVMSVANPNEEVFRVSFHAKEPDYHPKEAVETKSMLIKENIVTSDFTKLMSMQKRLKKNIIFEPG
jgi:hypothetical protein